MADLPPLNPAERAAQRAIDELFGAIRSGRSFRLEAGAGAGKTYSLVKALQLVIREKGADLLRRHQKVACITYTNVATAEIIKRTDGNPAVEASTIHSFCWGIMRGFQSVLREEVSQMAVWEEKLEEVGGIGGRSVVYDLGHRKVTEEEILLHHDDILTLIVALLERPKFRRFFENRFPIVFIDEYQDTFAEFAASLIRHFVEPETGTIVGFFGDSWQKIYPNGAGLVDHPKLQGISKEANFRSVPAVVSVLNKIRPALPQEVRNPEDVGTAVVFHSNSFQGARRDGAHWSGDLPPAVAHDYLVLLRDKLTTEGWDFSPTQTKILMLTHSVLAAEQNYSRILNVFQYNDALIRKEDRHIAFLADTVEPACEAFACNHYGDMFSIIKNRSAGITTFADKQAWVSDMSRLIKLRETGTIGEVIDLLKETKRPRLPESVLKRETRLAAASPEEVQETPTLQQLKALRPLPYTEIISLANFINNHTPFATKHGVKGAEFENVLVVLGRHGWNHYNWNQFLEWFPDKYPEAKAATYIRNRNLFYVACSRPKKRLALLFTQELSSASLETLKSWFGADKVTALDQNI